MDSRNVLIRQKSTVGGEETEYTYQGKYRKRGSVRCISYTDSEDGALTRVRIDADEKGMVLHRAGHIKAKMHYDPSRATSVKYSIDAYQTEFVLKTESYSFLEAPDMLRIRIEYRLSDEGGGLISQGIQDLRVTFT